MIGLATLAVELPFLVTCLLVQALKQCPHCKHEWLSWPILPGVSPWFFATFTLKLIPRDLSTLSVKFGWAVFTVSLIGLMFVVSRRSAFWRQLIAASFVVSTVLAVLAFLLIAA